MSRRIVTAGAVGALGAVSVVGAAAAAANSHLNSASNPSISNEAVVEAKLIEFRAPSSGEVRVIEVLPETSIAEESAILASSTPSAAEVTVPRSVLTPNSPITPAALETPNSPLTPLALETPNSPLTPVALDTPNSPASPISPLSPNSPVTP